MELLRGLLALAGMYFNRSEPAKGLAPMQRCLEMAEAMKNPRLLVGMYNLAGLLALSCGNLLEAVLHFEAANRQLQKIDRQFFIGPFLGWSAVACMQALTLHLMGRVEEAAKFVEQGLKLARESNHQLTLGHALIFGGQLLHCYRGEPEIARRYADEMATLLQDGGFPALLRSHGSAMAGLWPN
jgi:tetratricopeptide (TPR) repeat protein